MTNLDLFHLFFGIQVLKIDDVIFTSQPKYVSNLLKKFKMCYQLFLKLKYICKFCLWGHLRTPLAGGEGHMGNFSFL